MTFALQGLYQRHRARRIERLLRRFSDVMEASVSESMDRLTVTLTGQKTNATSLTAWLEDHGVIGSLVERVGTAPRSPEALLGPLALRTLVFLLPGLMVGAVHDFWPDLNLQIRDVLLNVQALLATGLIFVGAGPVVMAAFRRPADGGLAGSTLPILGGLVVFAVSLFAFLDGREPQFSAAMLAVGGIVLLDVQRRWLRRRSQRQLVRLRELAESEAYVLHSEGLFCLPATDLKVGDLCLVHPGGVVPSDGVVVAGQAAGYDALDVDTRHHYGAGDTLRAGVRVLEGALTIRVLRESPKSSLAYLIKVLAQPC